MVQNKRIGSAGAAGRWSERIKRWRASGLSKLSWCEAHGVSYTQMIRWCQRIEAQGKLEPVKLIPVFPRVAARSTLTVRLPGTLSIEVEEGFDAGLLRSVVRALSEEATC
jgi:hypothetical protein